jgi:uncharacterized protein (DUF1697 family)
MARLAAFLRAVNVGGTGKLAMADLRALAGDLGFANVRTHLASGNLLFDTDLAPAEAAGRLDAALGDLMGSRPGIVVRDRARLDALLHGLPFADTPGSRLGILFLERDATAEDIAAPRNRTSEALAVHAGHIVIRFSDGMGQSRLKIAAMDQGTMRNRNTVERIAGMLA